MQSQRKNAQKKNNAIRVIPQAKYTWKHKTEMAEFSKKFSSL